MSDDLIRRSDAIKVIEDRRCWLSLASQHGDMGRVLWDEYYIKFADAVDALLLIPSSDRPQEWIPCSERLPDACKDVLLTCEVRPINHKPFRYVCTAQWIPKFCEEALGIDWDEEITEYCEEDDEFYPLEGWYESISNWDDYSLVGIGDFAIAWKPLPEPWKGADDE